MVIACTGASTILCQYFHGKEKPKKTPSRNPLIAVCLPPIACQRADLKIGHQFMDGIDTKGILGHWGQRFVALAKDPIFDSLALISVPIWSQDRVVCH